MKNYNLPELRFSSFDGNWIQHRLSELCEEFKSGKSIKAEDIWDEGRYPVLGGNGLRGYTNTYNHDGVYALIGRQGALCGNMNISYGKAYFTEHAIAVKGNENNDTRFLFYLLGKMNLGQYSGQSAQPGLAVNKLIELTSFIPSRAEQTKISDFFKQLDETIALHQQELTTLKQTKQGFLQKMFPKEKETEPEIRFPGWDRKWEERKLDTIFSKIKNAFVGTATPYYVAEGNFYLESNNVKDGQINKKSQIFINDEFYEKQKNNWLHTNDLVMVQSGHVGHTAVIPEELNNTAAHALIIFSGYLEKTDPYFINYQMQSYKSKKKLNLITTGNTIKHILASEMKSYIIDYPTYEEQKIIGNFFKQLDEVIALHQQELDALQQTKKAFLQKMFI